MPDATPLMTFVLDYVRQFPGATFEQTRDAAHLAGFEMKRAIVYGMARKRLGLAQREGNTGAADAGPRTPRQTNLVSSGDVPSLLADLEAIVRDRERYARALEEIERVVRDALG